MIDKFYINLVSSKLEEFHWKSNNVANFRCYYCGDSEHKKSKKRGYLIGKDDHYTYYCHNCGVSKSFRYFLKDFDSLLFKEYQFEKLKNAKYSYNNKIQIDVNEPKFQYQEFNLPKISELEYTHTYKQIIIDRMIPDKYHSKLYYANNFNQFISSLNISYNKYLRNEPRIVIPFYDKNGNIFMLQGYTPNSELRYITIKLDEDKPKIYGLDTWNENKTTYVVEGPFDSMFIDNCLAIAGLTNIQDDLLTMLNKNRTVFMFDNEPRNKSVIRQMKRICKLGYKCVVYPPYIKYKDINEMILNGIDTNSMLLDNCVYQGFCLEIMISQYSKL